MSLRDLRRETDRRGQRSVPRRPSRETGFAFVMALIVALLVAGIATTLSMVSATQSQIERNYRDSKQTFYLAEAGVQHALWQLCKDPNNTSSLVGQGLDGNKYDVLISSLGNRRYQILARGRTTTACGTGVALQAAVFPQCYNYAVATPTFVDNTLAADIRGAVGGASVSSITISLSTWASMADWYISSSATFYGNLYYDGIIYVNGSLTLRGNENWVDGTIVVKDDLSIETDGWAHIASSPGMPALVVGHDLALGRSDRYANITVRGGAFCNHDVKIKQYNDVYILGCCVSNHRIDIDRYADDPTIVWDPQFRLRPPPGISQAAGTVRSWVPLPSTWRILTDLTPFESL